MLKIQYTKVSKSLRKPLILDAKKGKLLEESRQFAVLRSPSLSFVLQSSVQERNSASSAAEEQGGHGQRAVCDRPLGQNKAGSGRRSAKKILFGCLG